jgi:hypothetical protein
MKERPIDIGDDVKTTIAKDVVLVYPDYSKIFEVFTDASNKQLGAVTTQANRPIDSLKCSNGTASPKLNYWS